MKFKNNAFTIIELIMVIAILAIMAVVVFTTNPDMGPMRLDMAAKKMQSDIKYAQSLAASTQRWTRVSFSTANDDYSLSIGNNNPIPSGWTAVTNPLTKDAYTVVLNSGDFSNIDITLVFFNSSNNDLVFDQWGNPYGYTGAGVPSALTNRAGVRLNFSSDRKIIRVERGTGRVFIR